MMASARIWIVALSVAGVLAGDAAADGGVACTAAGLGLTGTTSAPKLVSGCEVRRASSGDDPVDIAKLADKLSHKPSQSVHANTVVLEIASAHELDAVLSCQTRPTIDFAKEHVWVVVWQGAYMGGHRIEAVVDTGKDLVLADRAPGRCHGGAVPRLEIATAVLALPSDRPVSLRDCYPPPPDPPCSEYAK